jgi:hypothetical protein
MYVAFRQRRNTCPALPYCNRTILRVDLLPSDRKVRYSILRRHGDKLAILDGFAIDVSHLPQLQMLTVNANARSRIEG